MKRRRPRYSPLQPGEVRLAHLPRGDKSFMRLVYATFKGHPYVGLRLWVFSSRRWCWLPSPKNGTTIRICELDDVIGALEAVRTAINDSRKPKQRPIDAAKPVAGGESGVSP